LIRGFIVLALLSLLFFETMNMVWDSGISSIEQSILTYLMIGLFVALIFLFAQPSNNGKQNLVQNLTYGKCVDKVDDSYKEMLCLFNQIKPGDNSTADKSKGHNK
jgi:hypothetical protein